MICPELFRHQYDTITRNDSGQEKDGAQHCIRPAIDGRLHPIERRSRPGFRRRTSRMAASEHEVARHEEAPADRAPDFIHTVAAAAADSMSLNRAGFAGG